MSFTANWTNNRISKLEIRSVENEETEAWREKKMQNTEKEHEPCGAW